MESKVIYPNCTHRSHEGGCVIQRAPAAAA